MITVLYETIDRYSKSGKFKTLAGAQKFAQKWVGKTPDISSAYQYAVSSDGVGKIRVCGEGKDGKAVAIYDLFPGCERPPFRCGGCDAATFEFPCAIHEKVR
jgi:hypothetical protein